MGLEANTPAVRGESLLLAHVQAFGWDGQLAQPPQTRLDQRMGRSLAGLLVHALRRDHEAPRSGLRV
jgi:hypothetical protein